MSKTLACPICGTENNAHHSAACVDIKKKGAASSWHPDHAKAIERKWIYSPKEAIDECNKLAAELADKDRQLAEARADADHWKSECNTLQRMVHEARAEIERKDALIEQMREALKVADDLIDEYAADYEHRDNVDEVREQIKAALVAEGGE